MSSRTRLDFYGCNELWLKGGDVVLLAGNKAFRVHTDVLSRNSEFFEGLFSLPQPENARRWNGYPLVRCYDTAEELRDFLLAFFDPHADYFQTNDQILHLLKLSDKYGAVKLHKRIVDGIARLGLFPTTLEGFQEMAKRERKMFNDPQSIYRFIQVAQHAAPYFLPSAYLLLATFPGLHRRLRVRSFKSLDLSPQFSEGMERMYDIAVYDIFAPLIQFKCLVADPLCSVATQAQRDKVREDFCPNGGTPCPFYPIKPENMRCAACRGYRLDNNIPPKLERYWNELPSLFGLPSWEELLRGQPEIADYKSIRSATSYACSVRSML